MSVKSRRALLRKLTRRSFGTKYLIYDVDAPITTVVFPLTGVFSMVSTATPQLTEVATIGNEGFVGLPLFFQTDTIPLQVFSQVSGEALIMTRADFKRVLQHENGELHAILQRYTQALFNQIAQHAACNATHPVPQRCARWLLMTHDRVGAHRFTLTQEFLAQMLGVRRATVTQTVSGLQKTGMISYKRGDVTIHDRKGLEKAACDHYHVIRAEYDRLIPQT